MPDLDRRDASMRVMLRRLVFFWVTSFALAANLYGVLWLVMPGHYVYGALYRMFLYHWVHPFQYMVIPCAVFGVIASLSLDRFARQTRTVNRALMTLAIVALTVLVSSPFGGMLWHFHDMQAGHFPEAWVTKMITAGFHDGLSIGWFVMLVSVPYNVIGSITCYFLLREGARRLAR